MSAYIDELTSILRNVSNASSSVLSGFKTTRRSQEEVLSGFKTTARDVLLTI